MTDAPQCGRMQRDMNRMNEKAPEVRDHELRKPSMQSMVQKVIMPMAATPSPPGWILCSPLNKKGKVNDKKMRMNLSFLVFH